MTTARDLMEIRALRSIELRNRIRALMVKAVDGAIVDGCAIGPFSDEVDEFAEAFVKSLVAQVAYAADRDELAKNGAAYDAKREATIVRAKARPRGNALVEYCLALALLGAIAIGAIELIPDHANRAQNAAQARLTTWAVDRTPWHCAQIGTDRVGAPIWDCAKEAP